MFCFAFSFLLKRLVLVFLLRSFSFLSFVVFGRRSGAGGVGVLVLFSDAFIVTIIQWMLVFFLLHRFGDNWILCLADFSRVIPLFTAPDLCDPKRSSIAVKRLREGKNIRVS